MDELVFNTKLGNVAVRNVLPDTYSFSPAAAIAQGYGRF